VETVKMTAYVSSHQYSAQVNEEYEWITRGKSRLCGRTETPGTPLNLDEIMSGNVGLGGGGVVSQHITVSSLCRNLLSSSKILLFPLCAQARGVGLSERKLQRSLGAVA
jgi:hypothetical protein